MDEGPSFDELMAGGEASQGEVILQFPVEVSVVGALTEEHIQALESRIWESLKAALT